MSKIEDALGKIQGSRSRVAARHDAQRHSLIEPPVVAQLLNEEVPAEPFVASGEKVIVNADALRKLGMLPPESHEVEIAQQYGEIKRPLIAHAFGRRATKIEDGNLIMVSSAISGEGKTFCSINLALSMARERDHSVLLVDADVAKPHTSKILGVANKPGLLDALEDRELDVRSLILPTDIDNLNILPAGQPRRHATELLASASMENVCRKLGRLSAGQIVIFDSPPLLQTSEAKVLASLTGQVVLVVRAETTSRDAVSAALFGLGEEKAVSLVLNQMRGKLNEFSQGYNYGFSAQVEPE
jgi:exopolysaccharide/PEP-CTERM locus tyrosine autokinase